MAVSPAPILFFIFSDVSLRFTFSPTRTKVPLSVSKTDGQAAAKHLKFAGVISTAVNLVLIFLFPVMIHLHS